jgi:hypothetical protein
VKLEEDFKSDIKDTETKIPDISDINLPLLKKLLSNPVINELL